MRSLFVRLAAFATLFICTLSRAELTGASADTAVSLGAHDTLSQSVQEQLLVEPAFDFALSSHWHTTLSARLRLDFADALDPGRVPTGTYSGISRPIVIGNTGMAELRDAYLEYLFENGLFRLGKQQIVLGRLDGLKVLDVLNPQDFREFILDDFSASRISLWSAYLEMSAGGWRTELAFIPDNTGHAIPEPGAWFELTAPRFRYGAMPDDPAPQTTTLRGSLTAKNSAAAIRLTRRAGASAFSAVVYSGIDHEPLGRLATTTDGIIVERYYERRELIGLSAETAVGAFAIRAEFSHQPKRVFNTRTAQALGTARLDQYTAGIGIDFEAPLDIFVNIQHLYDVVEDAPDVLVRPGTDRVTTMFASRNFAHDTIKLSGRWFYSHELGDRMMSLAMEYVLTDNTVLRLAGDGFAGDARGLFGQFAGRDRVTASIEHTF